MDGRMRKQLCGAPYGEHARQTTRWWRFGTCRNPGSFLAAGLGRRVPVGRRHGAGAGLASSCLRFVRVWRGSQAVSGVGGLTHFAVEARGGSDLDSVSSLDVLLGSFDTIRFGARKYLPLKFSPIA
jgi:hypothetical protein